MASSISTNVDQLWSLRAAMRRLWTDHVVWTRMYIVGAATGAPLSEYLTAALDGLVGKVAAPLGGIVSLMSDGDAAGVRLLRNQYDIGKAISGFYGDAVGDKLTDLLRSHILIAVALVSAARSGKTAKFKDEDDKWARNAEAIAAHLSSANPNWSKRDLVDLLNQHLALTKNETTARLKHDWDADIDAFDQILTEILTVADVLTDGIVKQRPDRFGPATAEREKATSLRLAMARLWTDHVVWTRQYIISAVADGPDADKAAARLLRNQVDIGNALGSVYGDAAGAKVTDLLRQHIMIAVEIVDAAKKHDDTRFKEANDRWDRNAEEIAEVLSSANPNWPRRDVADLLMQHLNLTRKELTAHMHKKREEDVEAFDQILTEILTVADVLATGIVKQFPDRF
jgi:phage terminase Nu1 subunit (DNA packaging protein)